MAGRLASVPDLSQQNQVGYRAVLAAAGKSNPSREDLKAWFGLPHGTAQYLAGCCSLPPRLVLGEGVLQGAGVGVIGLLVAATASWPISLSCQLIRTRRDVDKLIEQVKVRGRWPGGRKVDTTRSWRR